ncbi:MAG: glycosyltransferase [Marmoricola sp.]
MTSIVFATWDGGGNVPPLLALANELRARGHSVTVTGHPAQAASVEAAGLPFVAYRDARPFVGAAGGNPLALAAMWADPAMAEQVAALEADVFVVDCLLFGVMKALSDAGRPYVALEHMYDSQLVSLAAKSPLALALRLRGLRPMRLLEGARARIVATLPELDPVSGPTIVQTGPFVSGRASSASEPTILLSLSTFGYPRMERAWQRALDAVAPLPAKVIATTGPAIDPARLRIGADVEVHRWLPHAEVMPRVSLVLGHGGHSTTMLALAHDLPLVVMPAFKLGDQPRVAASVAEAGAGVALPGSASVERLREAVDAVLTDSSYRTQAVRLGGRIRESAGISGAADCVESLTPAGAPKS